MLIQPRYVERIWGGEDLATRLGKPAPRGKPIGESWEIYEENPVVNGDYAGQTIGELRKTMGRDLTGHVSPDELFPLLTKLIDAHEVLSVQVHPDDRFARRLEHQPYGKTECWYVIDAAPGAELTYGFARDTGPQEYEELVERGELEEILRSLPVKAGDVVYIPAGTVHAIGAGIVLYELQQTSDVTYRIYDWNRRDAQGKSRELHVDKARQVLDYHRWTRGPVKPLHRPGDGRTMLIAGPYFCMELIEAADESAPGRAGELSTHQSAVPICALERPLVVRAAGGEAELAPYSSLLVPAAAGSYSLEPAGSDAATARALVAYVPVSQEATREDLRSRAFSEQEIDAFLAQFAPAQDLGEVAAAPAERSAGN
jgi:mannose-6-phosphate isomerase